MSDQDDRLSMIEVYDAIRSAVDEGAASDLVQVQVPFDDETGVAYLGIDDVRLSLVDGAVIIVAGEQAAQ
ncbi:MAG: hypothetical protein ACRCYU_12290 [Nocardioides sp.]